MDKIDELIKKALFSNKKIAITDIVELNLTDDELDVLFNILNEKKIDIIEENDNKTYDNTYESSEFYTTDLYKQYYTEINKIPLLTPDEETKLGYNLKSDDEYVVKQAKKKLIESNLRLSVRIATSVFRRNKPRKIELLDLIQEGNIGLHKAVDKFDVSKGFKFSTYATWWIRQSVCRALSEQSRLIRLPVHADEIVKKINRVRQEYVLNFGREPNEQEISDILDISLETIQLLKRADQEMISLQTPLSEEDETELINCVKSDDNTEDEANNKLIYLEVKKVMERLLTPREMYVVSLRYGIGTEKAMTLEEIAPKLNVTRERVRQIEYKAIKKLKYHYNSQEKNNVESFSQYVLKKTKNADE